MRVHRSKVKGTNMDVFVADVGYNQALYKGSGGW